MKENSIKPISIRILLVETN